MKKTFTKKFMQENCGCYEQERLERCSFMSLNEITLDSILQSEIPIKDKFWFVTKKLLKKEENQNLAIGVASIVLEIYEKKYPNYKAPREAIQAAKDYIEGIINIDELIIKRTDVVDAAAAASAAGGAYAAAYAAYAAADAAADDAYAASAYAAAAAYATPKPNYTKLLLVYLKQFCNNL